MNYLFGLDIIVQKNRMIRIASCELTFRFNLMILVSTKMPYQEVREFIRGPEIAREKSGKTEGR